MADQLRGKQIYNIAIDAAAYWDEVRWNEVARLLPNPLRLEDTLTEDALKIIGEQVMRIKSKTPAKKKSASKVLLNEEQSLSILRDSSDNKPTIKDVVLAISSLKSLGWETNMADGLNHEGRKGIVISLIEPVKTQIVAEQGGAVPSDNRHLPRS
jgi:hypothetical protein